VPVAHYNLSDLSKLRDAVQTLFQLFQTLNDESLFVGYKDVRFTAPVYAGDFMEYVGWIDRVGNTSFTCTFEAYKVISLPRDPALANSAANVLAEPVLCATATGTLMVKKDLQRPEFADPKFQVR